MYDSGIVQFPGGHALNDNLPLASLLRHKFKKFGKGMMENDELVRFVMAQENIQEMDNEELENIYDCCLKMSDKSIDAKIAEEEPKPETEE